MYAALGNGGKILRPTLAKAVVSTDGKIIKKIEPKHLIWHLSAVREYFTRGTFLFSMEAKVLFLVVVAFAIFAICRRVLSFWTRPRGWCS
jgi:membrane carboxypeptidase/penicillin-binding protein